MRCDTPVTLNRGTPNQLAFLASVIQPTSPFSIGDLTGFQHQEPKTQTGTVGFKFVKIIVRVFYPFQNWLDPSKEIKKQIRGKNKRHTHALQQFAQEKLLF